MTLKFIAKQMIPIVGARNHTCIWRPVVVASWPKWHDVSTFGLSSLLNTTGTVVLGTIRSLVLSSTVAGLRVTYNVARMFDQNRLRQPILRTSKTTKHAKTGLLAAPLAQCELLHRNSRNARYES